MFGITPATIVFARERKSFDRAGQAHGRYGQVEFRMVLDAAALVQQTIEDLRFVVADARNEAQPGDDHASLDLKWLRLDVDLGEFKAHIIAQSRFFATRELEAH